MRPIVTYVLSGTGSDEAVQETSYPGRCAVETGELLPVYDEYPGWRVNTSLDLIEEKG